jgi:hypothetical protein
MKIKVTFEKVFDSDEFFAFDENLAELTFEKFKEEILLDLIEYPYENLEDTLKFEEIKE